MPADPFDAAAETTAPAPAETTARKRPAAPAADDFSREIELAVPRQPLDRVKCAHLFGPFYRCNWWAPNAPGTLRDPAPQWALNTDCRVRKSSFLSATHTNGQLQITEINR